VILCCCSDRVIYGYHNTILTDVPKVNKACKMKDTDGSVFRKDGQEYGNAVSWAVLTVIFILILIPLNTLAGSGKITESDLLKKYAPVLYFHPEEKVYPWGINSILYNADLKKLRNKRKISMPVGSKDLLSNNSDKLYLDIRHIVPYHDSVNSSNNIDNTFKRFPFKVYGRRIDPQKNSTHIVLQYWLFYPFNDWHNDHEGDWELIQIHYAKDKQGPVQLTTSHHHSGSVISWDKVSKINGTHPKIFIAKGSHGNWPTSGNHAVGKIWRIVGIFRDKTSENGMVLYPEDIRDNEGGKKRNYTLEDISDVPRTSWIYWNGRWGDVKALFWGSKGPASPGVQDKWEKPIKWGNKPAKSSFWVYFGSPGYLHIYDPFGNHVGVTKKGEKDTTGEIEGNIPGTYFFVPSSDETPEDCAWINTLEDLRFEIAATRSANFNLSFDFDPGLAGQNEGEIAIHVIYKDIKITKGGTAKVNVPSAKLSERLEAIMTQESETIKGFGAMDSESKDLESTELELEDMIKKTRVYLKQKPEKKISDIMEKELAELEASIKAGAMERSLNKRCADQTDLKLAELELENMAEIARLSRKLVRKKGLDRVDEELSEIEDTLKGVNLLERLLKPILIMKIDLDGDGTIDKFRQPDRISWIEG